MKLVFVVAGGVFLAYLLINGVGGIILPFLVSYIAARMFRPAGVYLSRKCRVNEKAGCSVFACLLLLLTVYSAVVLSSGAIRGLGELDGMSECISEITDSCVSMFDSLPFHIFGDAERVRDAVLSYSGKLLEYVCSEGASLIGSTAKALPSFMLSAVVSAVSFFYLMADIDGVGAAVSSLIPEEKRESVVSAFRNVSDAVFGYIRGTLLLSLITFTALFVGFLVIRIPSPAKWAFLIAAADALPLIGCGIILVPWGIYKIITRHTVMGISLLVLYVLIWAIRQIFEPRILGRIMGVSPFVMLAAVYIGWKCGGFSGVIIFSCFACALKTLPRTKKSPAKVKGQGENIQLK